MRLSPKRKAAFQKIVWDFYRTNKRHTLPWRLNITPYKIWVSEIMLQQTQVDRVIPFFKNWMKLFPNTEALARASQFEILKAWKGLGYNSRALRMKKVAQTIKKFPKNYEELLELPGIGPYTAGAIMAFAYNQPVTMIETNIRRVYLHHFFNKDKNIHDRELLKLIEQTIDYANPREWYFALMDYGSYLGKTISNPNKKSRHYTIQKKFKGSNREIRGTILQILLETKKVSWEKFIKKLDRLSDDRERIEKIVDDLEKEGFLKLKGNSILLQ